MKNPAILSLVALCAVCGGVRAVDPHLTAIAPKGAQRGTTAVVTFAGANLNDVQEVIAYHPGVTVAKAEPLNKDQLRVTLNVAADCRLGEHAFRVRTAGGVSDLRTFWVGPLPTADEKEPNNDFAAPQPVALNSTVHGTIGGEDVDYYVVECKKGQRLSVEIEGMRLGEGFWDPFVAILNDKRFELAVSDDSPLTGQDGGCSIVCPADGKYVVQVRESSFAGGTTYRLHVGTFPRPTGVIPAGGKPGDEVELRFVGDPAGEIKQKVKLPAADANFRVHCQTADGVHPAGIKFALNDLPNAFDTPAAAQPAGAVSGSAPGAFNGVIEKPGETKHFRFAAKKGQAFDIRCAARRLGSPLDPVLHVSAFANNALGQYLLGNDDDRGSPDSRLQFTAPADGEYCAWVHDHLRKGGPDYFFRIEVTTPSASTRTGIPKVDGNNVSNQDRQNVAVPRGNRYAFLATVARTGWGGPANVSFDALPSGLSVACDPVDPGLNQVPVVLEATPDAPLGGRLADLRATPADPKQAVVSRTNLDVSFCIGVNNVPFHRLAVNKVAVAVTNEVPFSVEVVEPKAPLVQNGSMNLKVVAKRAAGFKGAITVYPLFTPPNVGIQGQVTIPENATEVPVYCNAAPNAQPRKWKTAFIATAAVTGGPAGAQGTGPAWVSTQLFTLEVAPPFVTFAQERTAVEQGQKAQLFGKLTVNAPFDGTATATVVGLPAKVTAAPQSFTKDAKELTFELATDKASPAGKHSVFCQVVVEKNGEKLTHNVGGNELRIDVPLPPKVAAAPPAAKPATPPPVAPAAPKRLSRLEQLRLEQEQREKEGKGGTPPAGKKDEKK